MRHLALAIASSALLLTACGGGGGDEPAPAYLAGTYKGSYRTTQDNCSAGGFGAENQQVVTISGSDINVQINTLSLAGGARPDGGLSAVMEKVENGVTIKVTVTYAMPEGQTAPGNGTFNSEVLIQTFSNPNGFTCTVRYNGQVTKIG